MSNKQNRRKYKSTKKNRYYVGVKTQGGKVASYAYYRTDNFVSFVKFLDVKFPQWTFFNIYNSKSEFIYLGTVRRHKETVTKNLKDMIVYDYTKKK